MTQFVCHDNKKGGGNPIFPNFLKKFRDISRRTIDSPSKRN